MELSSGDALVTVVGTFPYISVGEKLHLYGTWTAHATFGEQFKSGGVRALAPGNDLGDAEIPLERRGEGDRRGDGREKLSRRSATTRLTSLRTTPSA